MIGRLAAAQVAAQPDSWDALKQVTHRATYIFVKQDLNCVAGRIQNVTDSSLTLTHFHDQPISIERQDVLRIVESGFSHQGLLLYSARSSWSDVQALSGWHRPPRISVKSSSGEHEGKLLTVTESGLTLLSSSKKVEIQKAEISQLYYFQAKPPSDSAQYADDELVFMKIFDPGLWPYLSGVAGYIPVRLYDSSLPEDDAPLRCKNNPWNSQTPGPYVTKH